MGNKLAKANNFLVFKNVTKTNRKKLTCLDPTHYLETRLSGGIQTRFMSRYMTNITSRYMATLMYLEK